MCTSYLSRWLYVSRCELPASWAVSAVKDIVDISRPRNAALDVTGTLLFAGHRFAQFLEGPEDGIAALRDSIERDARHADVRTILSGRADTRLFEDWSLAYAGPSLFVSGQVEAVLDDAAGAAERLLTILQEFARACRSGDAAGSIGAVSPGLPVD